MLKYLSMPEMLEICKSYSLGVPLLPCPVNEGL